MLVVAHRLSTIMSADQIIVLEAGRIIERGTHDQLLSLGGKYSKMWSIQRELENVASHDHGRIGNCVADVKLSADAIESKY